jgi:hypothetical protein
MAPIRLFISHSHADKVLADALKRLLRETFKDAVAIDYSSDDAPEGGIRAGGTWLEWIMTTVRHSDVCIVILTEDSADAPWVTWETGAVTGVAMGSEGPADRAKPMDPAAPPIRVVPLTFGIGINRVPSPLQQQQAVPGDRETGVRKLLFMLQERRGEPNARAQETADKSVSAYMETVRQFMERRAREHPLRLQATDLSAVHLLNSRQGLTLEPHDGEIADGVRLRCGPFTGDAHQRWLLYPVGVDMYRITTADDTKCVSIENDNPRDEAKVILWDYEGHVSQHWRVAKASGAGGVLSTVSLVNAGGPYLLSTAVTGNDVVLAARKNVTNEDWWMLLPGTI